MFTRKQPDCFREFSLFLFSLLFPTSCPSFSGQHLNRIKSFAQECLKCLWVRLCENPFYTSGRCSGNLSPVFLEAVVCCVPTTQKLNLHHLLGTWLEKLEELQTGTLLCKYLINLDSIFTCFLQFGVFLPRVSVIVKKIVAM